jgi:type II secretory pathway pseudopilin PulG
MFLSTKKMYPQKAFTIIESLVAISIMLAAIAGPLTLANNSISNAVSSKQQLEAAYLGQDLLEYVRWVRDTHGFANFLGEVGILCTVSDPCAVDTTKLIFTGPTESDAALKKGSCADLSICKLYYDNSVGGTHQYGRLRFHGRFRLLAIQVPLTNLLQR